MCYSSVSVAPSFDKKKVEETRRLKAGTSTVIEIPFQAHPMPKAIWKFKNGDLPDARRFKMDTKKGMTTLSMSKVFSYFPFLYKYFFHDIFVIKTDDKLKLN